MKEKTSVARIALTLLLITAVVAAALAGVNMLTKDKIAAAQAEKTQDAIAQVLDGEPVEMELTGNNGIVQGAYQSEYGYAVLVTPAGFGGDITMMVGVTQEGVVTGVAVISHSETAGLGSVAGEDNAKGIAFRDQYVDQTGPFAVDKDGGTVDSITSATITSRAVTEGVNAALEFVKNLG